MKTRVRINRASATSCLTPPVRKPYKDWLKKIAVDEARATCAMCGKLHEGDCK